MTYLDYFTTINLAGVVDGDRHGKVFVDAYGTLG